jgi:hypothetical protein
MSERLLLIKHVVRNDALARGRTLDEYRAWLLELINDWLRASSPSPLSVQADRSHSGKVSSQFGNRGTSPTGEPE